MRAMILAAGYGKRMRPLTDHTPKPLLEAAGKPLIQYHIEALRDAGCDELVINTGWLGEQLPARFGEGESLGVRIHWSMEGEPMETAGGIRHALPLLGEAPFVLVNGDIWTDYDYSWLTGRLTGLATDDDAHLVLVDNPVHHRQGDFHLTAAGRVRDNGQPKQTYAGIACLHPRLFARTGCSSPQLAPLLREAMAADRVSGERYAGQWWDIGTPQRLHELNCKLRAAD